jgi:hypothetical protein
MTTITSEIRRAIEQAGDQPVRLDDPQTSQSYVLIKADVYDRIQRFFDEEDRLSAESMFPGIQEVFEDWNDPAMDIYNDMDPRK